MNLTNLRWPVVLSTTALTLAALFGTGYVVKSRTVDAPLEALLQASPVVEAHTVSSGSSAREIKVTMKETPDLEREYDQLDEQVKKVLQGQPYTIKVIDHRTPQLDQLHQRLNLFVQEALATGHYAQMADQIEKEAAEAGVQARFAVDGDRVYLQLKGDGAYLYSVLDRPKPPVTAQEGGFSL